MARYITLLKFTAEGARNLKDSTNRAHEFNALAAKAGVSVDGQYWTLGHVDAVLTLSADDGQKILHLLAQLAARGFVRTETMQAFSDTEFAAILK
jgi:uncharacterized protein with GYD domain